MSETKFTFYIQFRLLCIGILLPGTCVRGSNDKIIARFYNMLPQDVDGGFPVPSTSPFSPGLIRLSRISSTIPNSSASFAPMK